MRLALRIVIAILLATFSCRTARAQAADASATSAMQKAEGDYATGDTARALSRIQAALKACVGNKCSADTRAGLLRDRGSLEIIKGSRDAGTTSFGEALRLSPKIALNDTYATPDVRATWDAAHGEVKLVQPAPGDFAFDPVVEQAERTPIPIYVEFAEGSPPARVVVKYRSAAMSSYKTLGLAKMFNGWGGLIPCADVTIGVLRYYIQGFDSDNEPILNSGDPKHPFMLRVRSEISGAAPSLPGKPPPARCSSGATPTEAEQVEPEEETPKLADGEACLRDDQCSSASCNGESHVCTSEVRSRNRFARIWFGLSGSIDFVPMPSGNDVCLLTPAAAPANNANFYCTTPDGNDFPNRASAAENGTLTAGNAGNASGGIFVGNVRVMATLDYAVSQHVLAGVRLGYVFDTYPAQAAKSEGHSFFAPVHFEARATYLFGSDPLQRTGFRPLVLFAAGLSEFDADQTVMVTQTGVAGSRPIQAWHFGGPFFVAAGAGVRYAFSPYHAVVTALKLEGAIGSSGFLPVVSPELGVQLGF
ncbi:MAG: hypothetical protein ABI183_05335 [Polyangiaceae bacterium]